MGAFGRDYDETILRIPPASPSRRDYQLRSLSPSPSRPQSPWRPREQVSSGGGHNHHHHHQESESYPLARSNYYSGPLPITPQGVDRSFYSGPLPQGVDRSSYYSGPLPTITPPQPSTFSGPLSGVSATTTESFDFEFSTWAKTYHRQHDSGSMAGSIDVEEGKSVRGRNDDDAESVDDEPSSFYLSNPAESRARAAAEFAERAGRSGRDHRNCVSGELCIREEIAKQKSQAARGYKSGEILGLNICADGIYNSSSSSPPVANVVEHEHENHQHSGATAAWDALMSDAKKESKSRNVKDHDDDPNCNNSEMVAILFKWEGVSGKPRESSVSKKLSSRASTKPNSRSSSTASTKPNSRTSSTSTIASQKPNSRTSSTSTSVSQKPNSRTSSTSTVVSQKPSSRPTSTLTVVSQKPRTSSSTSQKLVSSRTAAAVPKKAMANSQIMATQEVKGPRTRVKCLESEFSFGGSHKFYGVAAKAVEKEESVREEAERASLSDFAAPPALKPLKTSSTPPSAKGAVHHQQFEESESVPKSPFSVPFKWEDEPGKAKLEVDQALKTSSAEEVTLQLPPRLVSASVKSSRSSPGSSTTKVSKSSVKQSRSGSTSETNDPSTTFTSSSVGNHSREASGIPSSRKFFDKDCFRRCRRLLVNLF